MSVCSSAWSFSAHTPILHGSNEEVVALAGLLRDASSASVRAKVAAILAILGQHSARAPVMQVCVCYRLDRGEQDV